MERELIGLLTDLCAKWGFCIPPDHFEQITKIIIILNIYVNNCLIAIYILVLYLDNRHN